MSIYQDIILDHYRNPHNRGRLKNALYVSEVFNSLCGDRIRIEFKTNEKSGKVEDVKFSGTGCVISQASASLLTEAIKGKTQEQLRMIDKQFMMRLLGIELGPNRIKCALLPLEAVSKFIRGYGQPKTKRRTKPIRPDLGTKPQDSR